MKTLHYVTASFPAWREYALNAIAQGLSETAFLASVHPLNRSLAQSAFRMEAAIVRRSAILTPSA